MILQTRTLHAFCFLVVDCGHIDLGFMVYLKKLLHIIWHFGYFDASFSKQIASMSGMLFLMFVQSLFQFGAKDGKREGYYGEKNYLGMSCTMSKN